MRRAVIVTPLRTPVGTEGGVLRAASVERLASTVIAAVVDRSGVDPERIDDVIFSNAHPGPSASCIGRWAALDAGLPIEVSGMELDRRGGGGLQAIASAAMMVQSGAADVVLAGGVESMSNAAYAGRDGRSPVRPEWPEWRFGPELPPVRAAERVAAEYGVSRQEADDFAARSHQRAAAAWRDGRFEAEVVPVRVPGRDGEPILVERDEGICQNVSLAGIAGFKPWVANGVVTQGNASRHSDAAAACLVVGEDRLATLGLQPLASIVGWTSVGCHPIQAGIGPVVAVKRLFQRIGLGLEEMDLVEINEAFACEVLAVLKLWRWNDLERINVNGSGISLGHPVGATGARIMCTLLHELGRRRGRFALETMCVGGGQGIAAVFERL